MQKQPFTENGLQQLLLALYALPNPQLRDSAEQLRNEPLVWIQEHFELDAQQLAYLEQMSAAMIIFMAQQGSIAIEHRLLVTLTKQTAGDPPKQDKLFTTSSSLSVSADANGRTMYGGTLQLEVNYIDKS